MDEPAPAPTARPARRGRLGTPAKVTLGLVAVLCWGLLFDALVRTGRWFLDTSYSPFLGPLHDLDIHYLAAHLALHHHALYRFGGYAFSNPPLAAYAFAPFHAIGFRATMTVWTVGQVACLAVVLAVTLRRFLAVAPADAWLVSAAGLAPASMALFFPFHSMLVWGQLALVLMTLVFVDLFVVPPRFRGVLIGAAAAVKLLPALFVVWLLTRKELGAVARAAVTFVVLTVAAAALWVHASVQYWLHVLPSSKALLLAVDPRNIPITARTWIFGVGRVPNQSLRGMLGRPPFLWFSTFPWIVLAVCALGAGLYVTYRLLGQRRDLAAFVTLMVTTMLASPVSWLHYWVFVALCPFLAIAEWRQDRPLAIASVALAVLTCANLEDLVLVSRPLTTMVPACLFVVRNLYVLGALGFLVTAAVRVRHGAEVPGEPAPPALLEVLP